MNGYQLESVLEKDDTVMNKYGGIYPSTILPKRRFSKPRFFIANRDGLGQPGSHWTAFYFPRRGPAEFFDSGGKAPSTVNRNFTKFLKRHSKNYVYNNQRLQSSGSSTCGPFVLYYVMHRSHNVPMRKIIEKFDRTNYVENDKRINEWIEKVYKL
jgi:hypothetical protein